MSQCVPSWELDEKPNSPRLGYEVAELTWENGQPAMHGLGLPRIPSGLFKATSSHASPKYNNNWEKQQFAGGSGCAVGGGGGTLESIVNQATTSSHHKSAVSGGKGGGDDLLSWFVVPPSATMDALVPCSKSKTNNNPSSHVLNSVEGVGARVGGTSTHVGSCNSARNVKVVRAVRGGDMAVSHDWSSRRPELSVSNSGTCGKEYSRQLTLDTTGFTSTSLGSPENSSSDMQYTNKTADDDNDDSVCHGRTQSEIGEVGKKKGTGKGSLSTKRSRAAAIHNQSERKRRDKINQRMKTLQKMIPNSSKNDKASMLDEVIEYLKQLQAQVQMVSRMNLPQMMLPLAMQQQQMQMAMMGAPMGMGLPGMGMGMRFMDMNTMGRNSIPGMPPVLHPSAFMQQPPTPWDGSSGGDHRLPSSGSPAIHDPLTAFLACQSQQPMTMDAYSRMAALFQQFQQLPGGPSTKN